MATSKSSLRRDAVPQELFRAIVSPFTRMADSEKLLSVSSSSFHTPYIQPSSYSSKSHGGCLECSALVFVSLALFSVWTNGDWRVRDEEELPGSWTLVSNPAFISSRRDIETGL